jgi:hypothetical protein
MRLKYRIRGPGKHLPDDGTWWDIAGHGSNVSRDHSVLFSAHFARVLIDGPHLLWQCTCKSLIPDELEELRHRRVEAVFFIASTWLAYPHWQLLAILVLRAGLPWECWSRGKVHGSSGIRLQGIPSKSRKANIDATAGGGTFATPLAQPPERASPRCPLPVSE